MHLLSVIGIGVAAAIIGLVAVVLLARRASAARDLGVMSGPWITEHRSSEHTVH
jgi:hypothetical protein